MQNFSVNRNKVYNYKDFTNDKQENDEKHIHNEKHITDNDYKDYSNSITSINKSLVSFGSANQNSIKDYRNAVKGTPLEYKKPVFVNLNAVLNLANQYNLDLTSDEFTCLRENVPIIVGREGNILVPPEYTSVSRKHLIVEKTKNGFIVTDISKNGSRIYSSGNQQQPLNINNYINNDVENMDAHYNFGISHPILKNMSSNHYWSQYNPKDKRHCAWKMHVYADTETEWRTLVDKLGGYLKNNDIFWKTLSPYYSVQDLNMSGKQKGKAFTIYPKSEEEFRKIACDVSSIIKQNGLERNDTQILGDRQLGNTGRIFYRYELKSGKYANKIFDINKTQDKEEFHKLYDLNRGGSQYLAFDMQPNDDPFLYFNPDNGKLQNAENNKQNRRIIMDYRNVGDRTPLKYNEPVFVKLNAVLNLANQYNLDLTSDEFTCLRENVPIIVGREGNILVPSKYTSVSRKHLIVEKTKNGFIVTDISKNGTRISNKYQ